MNIAFVVQRYGMEINGGAELHCRYVAEHLSRFANVEVLTTCAKDYITWRNHYPAGLEKINTIPVRRFPVSRERNPEKFGRLQDNLLKFSHTEAEELEWMEEEGPSSTALIRYIKKNQNNYDFFIFFSYRYYHSFHGIRIVPHKSILVPTAEEDAIVRFSIFRSFFHLPQAIVYNSVEEKRMINYLSSNYQVPGDIVGVGSEIPQEVDGEAFRQKFQLFEPYLLYVGRIDQNKGCGQLFDYFLRYRKEVKSRIRLVLIGSAVMKIPEDPAIVHLGFLPDQDKFNGLAASELLVMPSFYESLSMVLLEAWALGKPTLANGNCRVLMGQSIRSNAGLFYTNYEEFRNALEYLRHHPEVRHILGKNGKRFYGENYDWPIIEQKYLNLMNLVRN